MQGIPNQNITPEKKTNKQQKKIGDDESLWQCTVFREGRQEGVGEKEGEGAASHFYFSSVIRASAGRHCFMPFFYLPVSSPPLCFLPSHQPSLFLSFTHSSPSLSCLSSSPRGLIYGCGAPETGMTTHTFLCCVSLLACWLVLWLPACTWCVFALYLCHRCLKQKCSFLSFCLVHCCQAACVSCCSCKHTAHIY